MSSVFSHQLLQNPKDLLILIKAVLEFSGLYLFERNISQFKMFMDGYQRCAILNGINLSNADVLEKFNLYLVDEYGKIEETSFGWFDFFADLRLSELEKFELFSIYFNSFLDKYNKALM